jgi:hypothetical protein
MYAPSTSSLGRRLGVDHLADDDGADFSINDFRKRTAVAAFAKVDYISRFKL